MGRPLVNAAVVVADCVCGGHRQCENSVGRPLVNAAVVVTDCVCGGPGQKEGQVHQTGFPGLQQSGAGDSV